MSSYSYIILTYASLYPPLIPVYHNNKLDSIGATSYSTHLGGVCTLNKSPFVNETIHSAFLASGRFGTGFDVYDDVGRNMFALGGLIICPYSQDSNNNLHESGFPTLFVSPWLQLQDPEELCIKSLDSRPVVSTVA